MTVSVYLHYVSGSIQSSELFNTEHILHLMKHNNNNAQRKTNPLISLSVSLLSDAGGVELSRCMITACHSTGLHASSQHNHTTSKADC